MRLVLTSCVLLCACGAPSRGSRDPELEAMLEVARAGEYRSWLREPAPHRSAGPHATVRTFINSTLEQSLRAGETTFPPGSIALKELFDGNRRTGWAIDWKLEDGQWRFFEGFDPSLDQYFLKGTDNGCAGCHRPGVDYLLTPFSAFGATDAPQSDAPRLERYDLLDGIAWSTRVVEGLAAEEIRTLDDIAWSWVRALDCTASTRVVESGAS